MRLYLIAVILHVGNNGREIHGRGTKSVRVTCKSDTHYCVGMVFKKERDKNIKNSKKMNSERIEDLLGIDQSFLIVNLFHVSKVLFIVKLLRCVKVFRPKSVWR